MNIPKKFFLKSILTISFLLLPTIVLAFPYYSAETQQFDKTLSEDSNTQYLNPKQIYITQITTPSEELSRNPSKWTKSLYHYTITRLHFSDMPYTYLLDENGIIYQGNTTGIGANPQLQEPTGAITIGYLSNNPVVTNRASESLSLMVEEISSRWGIAQLSTVKLLINQQDNSPSTVTPQVIENEFSQSVSEALTSWQGYTEENLPYKVKLEEVIYEKDVVIGERLDVKVTIKNINDFIWFTDTDPIYISVKDGQESDFAVNKDWESFSKPISISDQHILPGQTVELEFQLEAKVFLGETQESFEILKFEGSPFEDSSFDIVFNITKGDKQLVEVSSSEYGFVNIRDCRWYSCEKIDSADNGAVFILETEEAGWSKIRYDTDLSGWVNSRYLKKI